MKNFDSWFPGFLIKIFLMRVLIVGCGYVGLPLGKELARQGHEVFGLRRSALAEAELQAAGITPLHADITQPETLAKLPRDFDWVVNCAASGGGGADDYRKIYLEGNRNLVSWLADSPLKKFIYTSSTSVYGQNDGSRGHGKSPGRTGRGHGKSFGGDGKIIAGGGGRTPVPRRDFARGGNLRAGRAGTGSRQFLRGEARIEGDGSRWLNMIHRDDLIGVIIAALRDAASPGKFSTPRTTSR